VGEYPLKLMNEDGSNGRKKGRVSEREPANVLWMGLVRARGTRRRRPPF